jgi:molybdopterin-guanine dinucleotide biosynthesis protein A
MGRDKALLPFRGGLLSQAVARAVAEAAGSAVLVGSVARYGWLGYPVTPDIYPGEGPLGGILTVLQNTTADWNLIVACDMPGVSGEFLRSLLDAATRSDAHALVPVGPSGLLEPLCAVYHRKARPGLYAAFERGIRKVATALEEVRTAPFPVMEVACFQNLNTPEDWAGYVSE